MLMAEGDRELYRRQQAALVREREIMKDVPGWEVGVHVLLSDGDLTWFIRREKVYIRVRRIRHQTLLSL